MSSVVLAHHSPVAWTPIGPGSHARAPAHVLHTPIGHPSDTHRLFITSTHLPHPAITRAMAQCNSIQVIVHRLPVLDPFVPSPLPHRLLPSTRANGSHTHCNSGWATETRPTWPRPSFHLLLWLRRTLRPCSHHLLLLRVGIANKLARLHHTAPASTH